MSDYIPPEVLVEIFLRLPVKSLLRFCTVCKLWYSLISHPSFVSSYTHLQKPASFILRRYSKVQKKEIFSLNYDSYDDGLVQYRILNCPLKSRVCCFEIVGSCYGLLCLTDTSTCPKPIILWNPLVAKSLTLPVRHNYTATAGADCDAVIGFGFDSKTSDYKVVRIVGCGFRSSRVIGSVEVEIFGLGVGVWRSIKIAAAPPYVITPYSLQTFLNGAIHWIGYKPQDGTDGGKLAVAVFDVSGEVFGELEMPDEMAREDVADVRNKITVSVFGKSLCLMRYYGQQESQHHPCYHLCHIWVMKEYGVSESWSKLYEICPWGGFSKTLGLRRNGEILLVMGYGAMVSYDPESQMISPLEISGESCSFYLEPYVESLFLWKGLNGV